MLKLKNWKEAFKIKGLDSKVMPDVSNLLPTYRKQQIALYILTVVIEVLNGDWKPDYTDQSQLKFEIWWKVKADAKRPSGFGLSYCACDYWYSGSFVGVRFAFKDRETAKYAATHPDLLKLFEDLYLIK